MAQPNSAEIPASEPRGCLPLFTRLLWLLAGHCTISLLAFTIADGPASEIERLYACTPSVV